MDGCDWKQQSTRLINPISWRSAALSIKNGENALICFPDDYSSRRCEVYDSKIVMSTYETNYPHQGGKLALYRGKPTTVGSSSGDGSNTSETLSSSGWRRLTDFPKKYFKKVILGDPDYVVQCRRWVPHRWMCRNCGWSADAARPSLRHVDCFLPKSF